MLDKIRIVLIGTSHPGNLGGTARAMKNMGLDDLALVAPRSEHRSSEAISRASGADTILAAARRVETLEEAVADCSLVVGASARSRTLPWPLLSPRQLGERLPMELATDTARVALVFGREDSGLTNAELQRCHAHVHIPCNPDFSSLNLAAAVQVVTYECRLASEQANTQSDDQALPFGVEWDSPPASHAELEHLFTHMEQVLVNIGFHDPAKPRQLMARLRRLYLRARPDQMEANILRGMLTAVEKQCLASTQTKP